MDTSVFVAGYLTQLIGTSVLLHEIWRKKSVYGLSFDTQICQLLATLARVVWSYETRIVYLTAGHVELCLSTLMCALTVWSWWHFRQTCARSTVWLRWWMILAAGAGLGLYFHPGAKELSLQILVAFTFYVEGAALGPQLLLLRKVNDADGIATAYMLLTIFSRFIRIGFWALLYSQGDLFPGLLLADVVHTVMCAHFIRAWWLYIRAAKGSRGGLIISHKKIR